MIKGLVEDLSSRVTANLCVGPAPRTADDILYIITKLRCMSILNVSNESAFMIEGKSGRVSKTEEQFLKQIREKGIPIRRDIDYKHVYFRDGEKFDLEKMLEIIEFANSQLEKHGHGFSMYIHCHAGISRSPAAIAIILIGIGHEPDEVKKFVERNHPQTLIHPEIWSSITKNADKLKGKTLHSSGQDKED